MSDMLQEALIKVDDSTSAEGAAYGSQGQARSEPERAAWKRVIENQSPEGRQMDCRQLVTLVPVTGRVFEEFSC